MKNPKIPLALGLLVLILVGVAPESAHAGINWRWTVTAPNVTLDSISITPGALYGGESATGTVRMVGDDLGPAYGVRLSSSDSAASVPLNVTIGPSGLGHFTIDTHGVALTKALVITATYQPFRYNPFHLHKVSTTLVLWPAAFVGLSIDPGSETGGRPVSLVFDLRGEAPADGLRVSIGCSHPQLVLAAEEYEIPAGSSKHSVPVSTEPVAAVTAIELEARIGSVLLGADLTLLPTEPEIRSLTLDGTTFREVQYTEFESSDPLRVRGKVVLSENAPSNIRVRLHLESIFGHATPDARFASFVEFEAGQRAAEFDIEVYPNQNAVPESRGYVVATYDGSSAKAMILVWTHP